MELRVLSFNNLSTIYKTRGKIEDSIKAIDQAIKMESILVEEGNLNALKNIPSTYINKSVILSE